VLEKQRQGEGLELHHVGLGWLSRCGDRWRLEMDAVSRRRRDEMTVNNTGMGLKYVEHHHGTPALTSG